MPAFCIFSRPHIHRYQQKLEIDVLPSTLPLVGLFLQPPCGHLPLVVGLTGLRRGRARGVRLLLLQSELALVLLAAFQQYLSPLLLGFVPIRRFVVRGGGVSGYVLGARAE